jgi:hypothetical protein
MRPPRRGSAVSTADYTTSYNASYSASYSAGSSASNSASYTTDHAARHDAGGPTDHPTSRDVTGSPADDRASQELQTRRLSLIRGGGTGARQLSLPLEYEVAPGVPAIPPTPTHLHLVGSAEPEVLTEPSTEGEPTLPPPGLWTMRLARAIAEVAHGERPAGQLAPHVSREQLLRLSRRGQAVVRHPAGRAQRGATRLRTVRGVRVCPVAPGVVEASAVLVGGQRAQAIALRLEAVGSQWIATAVELG